MEDSKDKFYFEGKYFDTGCEFVKYFNENFLKENDELLKRNMSLETKIKRCIEILKYLENHMSIVDSMTILIKILKSISSKSI